MGVVNGACYDRENCTTFFSAKGSSIWELKTFPPSKKKKEMETYQVHKYRYRMRRVKKKKIPRENHATPTKKCPQFYDDFWAEEPPPRQ